MNLKKLKKGAGDVAEWQSLTKVLGSIPSREEVGNFKKSKSNLTCSKLLSCKLNACVYVFVTFGLF